MKRFFLVLGPAGAGNHQLLQMLGMMGCVTDPDAGPDRPVECAMYGRNDSLTKEADLVAAYRSYPHGGIHYPIRCWTEPMERLGYEVRLIFLQRNLYENTKSLMRKGRQSWDEAYRKIVTGYTERMRGWAEVQDLPLLWFDSSLLARRPEFVIGQLEEFTGLRFPMERLLELDRMDDKWVSEEWLIPGVGWNVPKVYQDVNWNASQASKGAGLMASALILSMDYTRVVEIGVCNGFTSQILGHALAARGGGRLVSCDFNEHCCAISRGLLSGVPIEHVALCEDSTKVDWSLHLDGVDLGFIDGDHSYEGASGDARGLIPLVRRGGALVFHDYAPGQPGVMRAVNEIMIEGGWQRFEMPQSTWSGEYAFAVLQRN